MLNYQNKIFYFIVQKIENIKKNILFIKILHFIYNIILFKLNRIYVLCEIFIYYFK